MKNGFSKIGIASFVFALLSPIFTGFVIVWTVLFGGNLIAYNLISIFSVVSGLTLFAFVCGLITLFQKNTRKLFGIIGFILGIIEILSIVIFIVISIYVLNNLGKALGSGFGKM